MKNKGAELKKNQLAMVKMGETLKKNDEELEEIKQKANDLEKASHLDIEALQAEVTTRVRVKLIY